MNSPAPLTPPAAAPIISVQKISKRFPGVVALEDVSLDILPGQIYCISGVFGAGNTTLMTIDNGVLPEHEAEVVLSGKRVICTGSHVA